MQNASIVVPIRLFFQEYSLSGFHLLPSVLVTTRVNKKRSHDGLKTSATRRACSLTLERSTLEL